MLLKQKIALIMGAVILLMIGLNAAVLLPVADSFSELEVAEAARNSGRVEQAIVNYTDHLARNATDWSHWDEAYRFVAGEQPSFVDDNLNITSMANLGVNAMYFYDRAGTIVWGRTYDLETEQELSLAHFAPGALAPDDLLLRSTERRSGVRGIVITEAGPLLLASSPILPTDDPRPARGTLVLGRFLDRTLIDQLRAQTNVEFDTGLGTDAPGSAPPAALEHGRFVVEEIQSDVLVGRQSMADLYGQPRLEIQTWTPRQITQIGDRSIGLSLLSLGIVGVVAIAVVWILLQRQVLRPLTGLTQHILRTSATGDMDLRVPVKTRDECGVLAREFNRMLDRLADARRQLVDQSHRAGMAEMAAGVMHNLRNGLTPLIGRLEEVSGRLRAAPGREIGRAVSEIEDPSTAEDRRTKLTSYVCATGTSLVRLNAATAGELDQAMAQARTLGEILKFQDRFIYSNSVMAEVHLGDTVRDAVNLIEPRLPAGVVIEVDPGLDGVAPVMAERVALVQVIHNLLVNGVEAIVAAHRTDGRIRVSASQAPQTGMVDLKVADNGIGISADDLARVFERGFTTKQAGAGGLGLHWSANAVGNMHGRLQAESTAGGGSTVLHVLLPAIEQRQAAE